MHPLVLADDRLRRRVAVSAVQNGMADPDRPAPCPTSSGTEIVWLCGRAVEVDLAERVVLVRRRRRSARM